jgi:[ribosomal protein S18]-alanine N-acetyltransferase
MDECTESGDATAPLGTGRTAALEPSQLQACLALDQLCFGGLWSSEQWRNELDDPHRPGLGLWQGGQLMAMACSWLILDELHITLVAVDPSRRRQGLAHQLLQALLQQGRRLGATRATLEVSRGNPAALALYRALGFQTAGVRRAYYSNGDDALIQWLDLKAAA